MISKAQVAELVRLYSAFHGALDPMDPVILKAEEEFHAALRSLHAGHAPDLPFREFRLYALRECKLFLRKN